MDTQLTVYKDPTAIIVPSDAVKDQLHRLAKYANWLGRDGRPWRAPDPTAYRDALLRDRYTTATVSAHLSTVRARYADLVRERDLFFDLAAHQTDNPLERKAIVEEIVTRLENATDPKAARVTTTTKQDRADSEHLRLTAKQAERLIAAPGVDTL